MGRPVRVLQVAPLGAGGVTSLILNIAEKLDNNRVIFDYLTFYDRVEFNEERAVALGGKKYVVPIDHYKNAFVRSIYKFFKSIKVIRSSKADIIHINGSKPYDILVGVSAKLAGTKKVIFHSHNSNMKQINGISGVLMHIFQRLIPMISSCNLACSELAARFMFPSKIVKNGNYMVLRNAVDVSRYRFSMEKRSEYRNKIDIDDHLVICHIGRFMPQKNHKFLIDIFEKIHEKRESALLILIGNGELYEEIKQYVVDKGLEDAIWFLGTTNEIPEILHASDCFLLPSIYEGLPVVGVEVQAAGLPLILTDTITEEVGFTELAKYVSLHDSPEKWAEIVIEESSHERNREKYAEQVKMAGFDIYELTEKLTQLYETLIDS